MPVRPKEQPIEGLSYNGETAESGGQEMGEEDKNEGDAEGHEDEEDEREGEGEEARVSS